jgi:hypothetical protein
MINRHLIPHTRLLTFTLGLVAGVLGLYGVITLALVVALMWAQGSGAGHQSRHVQAAAEGKAAQAGKESGR